MRQRKAHRRCVPHSLLITARLFFEMITNILLKHMKCIESSGHGMVYECRINSVSSVGPLCAAGCDSLILDLLWICNIYWRSFSKTLKSFFFFLMIIVSLILEVSGVVQMTDRWFISFVTV